MQALNLYLKVFVVWMFVFSASIVTGQGREDIKNILSGTSKNKYEKAERLISKGELMTSGVDSTSSGRNRSRQVQREIEMRKEQISLLLKDGYKLKLEALNDYCSSYVQNSGNPAIRRNKMEEVLAVVLDGLKNSQKLYSKARNTSRLSKSVELQEDARKIQQDAVRVAENGMLAALNLQEEKKEEPEVVQVEITEDTLKTGSVTEETETVVVEQKNVAEPEKMVPAVETVAVVAAGETVVAKEEKPVSSPGKDVYFTIQIMADKTSVNVTRQRMIYKGDRKVIENVGDGWYRYSVGKFRSYSEAVAVMKREGIKGYVVAYNGNKRITVSEAKKLLGAN